MVTKDQEAVDSRKQGSELLLDLQSLATRLATLDPMNDKAWEVSMKFGRKFKKLMQKTTLCLREP